MSCPVMSCHVVSGHVRSKHTVSCHVMSCHVVSCHVISLHICTPQHKFWSVFFNFGARFFGLGVFPTLQRAPINATFSVRGDNQYPIFLRKFRFRIILDLLGIRVSKFGTSASFATSIGISTKEGGCSKFSEILITRNRHFGTSAPNVRR